MASDNQEEMSMGKKTERERQAERPGACDWIVYPASYISRGVAPVECRAATESGAFRVAEAECPGVAFVSAEPGRRPTPTKDPR